MKVLVVGYQMWDEEVAHCEREDCLGVVKDLETANILVHTHYALHAKKIAEFTGYEYSPQNILKCIEAQSQSKFSMNLAATWTGQNFNYFAKEYEVA